MGTSGTVQFDPKSAERPRRWPPELPEPSWQGPPRLSVAKMGLVLCGLLGLGFAASWAGCSALPCFWPFPHDGPTASATGTDNRQPTVSEPAIPTVTELVALDNPSVFGQRIHFRVDVRPREAGGAEPPQGQVALREGAVALGGTALEGGRADLEVSGLTPGSHTLRAVYQGQGRFAGSSSDSVVQTVGRARTVLRVTSSANPSAFGEALSFEADVGVEAPAGGVPSGAVKLFRDGGIPLESAGVGKDGKARIAIDNLSRGEHALRAVYEPDNDNYSAGETAWTQTVR